MAKDDLNTATSTALVRDLHAVKRQLLHGPVQITSHGRSDFVVVPQDVFESWSGGRSADVDALEEKLAILLDASDTKILVLDEQMRIKRMNRAFRRHVGIDDGDYRGNPSLDFARTATDSYIHFRIKEVLESGREDSFEVPSEKYPGVTLKAVIRRWPGGVAMFITDISAQMLYTEECMRTEGLDRALASFVGASTGTGAVDRDGRFLVCSQALACMCGTRADSVVGTSIFTLLDTESRAGVERRLAERSPEAVVEKVRYLRHGEKFAAADLAMTPYASRLHPLATAIVLRDVGLMVEQREAAEAATAE